MAITIGIPHAMSSRSGDATSTCRSSMAAFPHRIPSVGQMVSQSVHAVLDEFGTIVGAGDELGR